MTSTTAPVAETQPLVLVVDDFDDARSMYCHYLALSGYRVAEAHDGGEAFDQAVELLPDVILMDLSMPNIDGWDATRRLKADTRTRHIPVIGLTGHALPPFIENARAAGCAIVLAKPCSLADLLRVVSLVLQARGHS